MRLGILTIVALVLLYACGTTAPTVTPTINIVPTQTRAAELAQLATLTAPTATATARPTPTATRPPRIPTINPTQPQARSNPTRAQACEFVEQYAARLGMAFDPGAPVEATVVELQRRQGIDPAGHTGYGNFVGDQLRLQIRACLAPR